MKFIFIEIIKGNLVVLIAYIISYVIEKITKIPFLWWNLRQKKNYVTANGAANLGAIFYFVVNIIVLFNDLRGYLENPKGYSFIIWLVLIVPLTIAFRKLHFKLTPIDPDRDNFDFSD